MYILLFSLCVLFFSFFYTSIVFNAEDVAQNLQKGSSYIPGIRPGANTAEYLDSILSKLTLIGAIYLIFICITPEIFMSKYGVALSLSGTSLLIVVSVIMDTITQVQTYLYTTQYGGLVKRVKVRHRG
jgi:preprotein translocase subunit SecY